jgi:hypothetical protein
MNKPNRQFDDLDHAIEEANATAMMMNTTADYQIVEYLKELRDIRRILMQNVPSSDKDFWSEQAQKAKQRIRYK